MKTCIFCQKSASEVKITKEHILPKWMRKRIPLSPDYQKNVLYTSTTQEVKPLVRNMPGLSPFEMTVSRVCAECNNGWLSIELEAPLQPIIEKLILSKSISLDIDIQRLLALWAIKTATLRALLDPGLNIIPEWVYNDIKNLTIPLGCTVYIGYCGEITESIITRYTRTKIKDKNIFLCTLQLKSIFLFISWCDPFAASSDDIKPALDSLFNTFCKGSVKQLWPQKFKKIKWPMDEKITFPPHELNDIVIRVLASFFGAEAFLLPPMSLNVKL